MKLVKHINIRKSNKHNIVWYGIVLPSYNGIRSFTYFKITK